MQRVDSQVPFELVLLTHLEQHAYSHRGVRAIVPDAMLHLALSRTIIHLDQLTLDVVRSEFHSPFRVSKYLRFCRCAADTLSRARPRDCVSRCFLSSISSCLLERLRLTSRDVLCTAKYWLRVPEPRRRSLLRTSVWSGPLPAPCVRFPLGADHKLSNGVHREVPCEATRAQSREKTELASKCTKPNCLSSRGLYLSFATS